MTDQKVPIIQVGDVVDEMEFSNDEQQAYMNIRTGEFEVVSNEELRIAEDIGPVEDLSEWEDVIGAAAKILSSDDYLRLPSKLEIHEYGIMKDFCFSLDDERLGERLLNSINNRDSFRYFKEAIQEYGIQKDWNAFRDEAFKRIAIEWLEDNGIPYSD